MGQIDLFKKYLYSVGVYKKENDLNKTKNVNKVHTVNVFP